MTSPVGGRRGRRTGSWLLLGVGLAAAVTGGWLAVDPPGSAAAGPDAGTVPTARAVTPQVTPARSPSRFVSGLTVTRTAAPAVTAPTGTGPSAASAPSVAVAAGPPVALRLPGSNGAAPVVPVTSTDGALGVPEDPSVLGWWAVGARPGQGVGSVVVDGHIDTAKDGLGVFAQLPSLDVGARVVLTDATGRATAYTVTARRSFPKASLPDADVFDQTVAERLVLITCGGPFDRVTRHYRDNVVVYGVPAT